MAEQWDRGDHAPALAEHEHRVEGVEPGAAVGVVDQQPRPAGLAGHRPQLGELGVAVERLARGFERLHARERAARGLAEEFLLV